MDFGIAPIATITIICYLVGLVVKITPFNNDKFIPVICGVVGCVIGILSWYFKFIEFPNTDVLTAASVGIVSGLAATGVNQAIKQVSKN